MTVVVLGVGIARNIAAAGGSITFVQSAAAESGSAAAQISVSFPQAVKPGDLLVAVFGSNGSNISASACSDPVNGTWTQAVWYDSISGSSRNAGLYYLKNQQAGGSLQVTCQTPPGAANFGLSVAEYAGVETGSPLVTTGVHSDSSWGTSLQYGPSSGAVAVGQLVVGGDIGNGSPSSENRTGLTSGYTARQGGANDARTFSSLIDNAASLNQSGVQTVTGTLSANESYTGVMAVFKPAGATPSPGPSATPSPTPTPRTGGVPAFDHIVVIVMENHAYSQVVGNREAPYENQLANRNALATGYSAITHPSLPNYLALTGGSTAGVTTDCDPSTCSVSARSVADLIESSGRSWRAYMDSMPAACATVDSYPYAAHHDPWVYYTGIAGNASRCGSHVVPYSQLKGDLGNLPSFVWITPDLCNDMHDCSIAVGDNWLSNNVPNILSSPAFTQQHSLLVITFDEDDGSESNRVATILAGWNVKTGYQSTSTYNHYSLLKTIEQAWGLSSLAAGDGGAGAMTDVFAST